MRVAPWHEHLKNFREPFSLWIGSFSDSIQQTPQNIEDVNSFHFDIQRCPNREHTKEKGNPKRKHLYHKSLV